MELLSPAGSMESLVAAVQNGADAVYFGGGSFNARRYADNFVGDGLPRAVDYCHERGVRAYITLNTLIFDREIPAALDFAAELYRLGADAVLVQDLGLAAVIRKHLPGLTLHASTQMGIHDLGGLSYCRSIGMTRAVLARETSLEQIKYLVNNSDIEVETFAHGALCMSFSGSCLYSSMSGERSGNRGTCAQPCRKRACVSGRPGMNDLCLSPNDICMIEQLDALKKAGVACIKLEGRMKKPEYVAYVTRCYRAALDGAGEKEIMKLKSELFELFNRGNFSTAHLITDTVRTDRTASSKPSKELVRSAEMSMQGENRKASVDMQLSLKVGEKAKLYAESMGHCITVAGAVVQQAKNPQTANNYRERLAKLGDTPLELSTCSVDMSDDCYISAAELNALRRDAVKALLDKRHVRNIVPKYAFSKTERESQSLRSNPSISQSLSSNPSMSQSLSPNPSMSQSLSPNPSMSQSLSPNPSISQSISPNPSISQSRFLSLSRKDVPIVYARVRTAGQAELAFAGGADIVAIEPVSFEREQFEPLQKYRECGKKLILALPNVIITAVQNKDVMSIMDRSLFDGAEANNIGQTELILPLSIRIAGIGLNALNTETIAELMRLGFNRIIPSPELTAAQFNELAKEYSDIVFLNVHGRTPLMQLVHCPVKEHGGCKNCRGFAGIVTDEAGREFPLVNTHYSDKCLVRMLNCHTTDLIDIYKKLPDIAGVVLSFAGEDDNMITERLDAIHRAMRGESVMQLAGSTRGHWNRKID